MSAPVAVALDAPDLETAVAWAGQAGPYVSTMKIGLELYLRAGQDSVHQIREAAPDCAIFLDLKLHDIPNTVAGAARSVAGLRPELLTVHASGGAAMIRAAVESLPDTLVTAVTVLTSLDGPALDAVGLRGPSLDAAKRLAVLAVDAGARALVCSPQEVAAIRAEVGPEIKLVTPGVRPAGSSTGDQARIATPQAALAAGADLLVIGRPITAADAGDGVDDFGARVGRSAVRGDVAAAAQRLSASLSQPDDGPPLPPAPTGR